MAPTEGQISTPRRACTDVLVATLIARQLRAEDMPEAAAVVDRIAAAMTGQQQ